MVPDRCLAVMALLCRHELVTARMIADHFGVAEKTARRDVGQLQALGVPVVSVVGRNGGWMLDRDVLDEEPGPHTARVRVRVGALRSLSGTRVGASLRAVDAGDWVEVDLVGADDDHVARVLASIDDVEVLGPSTVTDALARLGRRLWERYRDEGERATTPPVAYAPVAPARRSDDPRGDDRVAERGDRKTTEEASGRGKVHEHPGRGEGQGARTGSVGGERKGKGKGGGKGKFKGGGKRKGKGKGKGGGKGKGKGRRDA